MSSEWWGQGRTNAVAVAVGSGGGGGREGGRAIRNLNRRFIKEGNDKKEIQSERNYKIKRSAIDSLNRSWVWRGRGRVLSFPYFEEAEREEEEEEEEGLLIKSAKAEAEAEGDKFLRKKRKNKFDAGNFIRIEFAARAHGSLSNW